MDGSLKWILIGDGLHRRMNCSRWWIAARDPHAVMDHVEQIIVATEVWQLDMNEKQLIATAFESWPYINEWHKVNNRRSISINGSWVVEDSYSSLVLEAKMLQWSSDMQTKDVPAAWLHQVPYWVLLRAIIKPPIRDAKLISSITESQCWTWFQHRLENPYMNSWYQMTGWESSLYRPVWHWMKPSKLAVTVMKYNRVMTIPGSTPISSTTNHFTGCTGRKRLGAYLLTERHC